MRAKLIFELPEDDYEFKCAIKGMHYHHVITQMETELRRLDKYEGNETARELRDYFNDILQED